MSAGTAFLNEVSAATIHDRRPPVTKPVKGKLSFGARWAVVPRYYFNICCDRFEATDVVGEYCRDRTAAHLEALRAARAIVRKQLTAEELPQRGWIEVEDERHRTILRVPLRSVAY